MTIQDDPVAAVEYLRVQGAGAVLCFEGVERPREVDLPVKELRCESFDPMVQRELPNAAKGAGERLGVVAGVAAHSPGFVPCVSCSCQLQAVWVPRKEAIALPDLLPPAIETLRGGARVDGRPNALCVSGQIVIHEDAR